MIGIFDSGSGGLTVLKEIRARFPSADVLYFGDIKRAPYGSKTHAELSRLTIDAIKLLRERGVTSIVSACNSVSAALAISLLDGLAETQFPLIEMVGPTVSYLKNSSARILLVATPATVSSGIYQNAFHMMEKQVDILPIPDLAGAIEFGDSEEKIEALIRKTFKNYPKEFKVLVLACTHYPLVSRIFQKVLGKDVLIFDPAIAVAERVEKQFWPREAGDGKIKFLISADSKTFRSRVAELFPEAKDAVEVIQ